MLTDINHLQTTNIRQQTINNQIKICSCPIFAVSIRNNGCF